MADKTTRIIRSAIPGESSSAYGYVSLSWNIVRANTLSHGPVQGDLFLPGDVATKANRIETT